MQIKNVSNKPVEQLLERKTYKWQPGQSVEVDDNVGTWMLYKRPEELKVAIPEEPKK